MQLPISNEKLKNFLKPGLLGARGPPAAGPVEKVQDNKRGSVRVGPHAGETQEKQRLVIPKDVLVCSWLITLNITNISQIVDSNFCAIYGTCNFYVFIILLFLTHSRMVCLVCMMSVFMLF